MILYIRRYMGRKGIVLNIAALLTIINFGVNLILLAAGLISMTQTLIITQILHIVSCVLIVAAVLYGSISQTKRDRIPSHGIYRHRPLMHFQPAGFYTVLFKPAIQTSSKLFVTGLVAFVLTLVVSAIRAGTSELITLKEL